MRLWREAASSKVAHCFLFLPMRQYLGCHPRFRSLLHSFLLHASSLLLVLELKVPNRIRVEHGLKRGLRARDALSQPSKSLCSLLRVLIKGAKPGAISRLPPVGHGARELRNYWFVRAIFLLHERLSALGLPLCNDFCVFVQPFVSRSSPTSPLRGLRPRPPRPPEPPGHAGDVWLEGKLVLHLLLLRDPLFFCLLRVSNEPVFHSLVAPRTALLDRSPVVCVPCLRPCPR